MFADRPTFFTHISAKSGIIVVWIDDDTKTPFLFVRGRENYERQAIKGLVMS